MNQSGPRAETTPQQRQTSRRRAKWLIFLLFGVVLIPSTWILLRDDTRIPVSVVGTLPWPPPDKVTNNLVTDGSKAARLITMLRSFPKAPKYDGGPLVGSFTIKYANESTGKLWIYPTQKYGHLCVVINRRSFDVPVTSLRALLVEAFPQAKLDDVEWLIGE